MKAELAKSLRDPKRSMFRLPVQGDECPFREGKPYIVKKATEDQPAQYITITEVREQALGEIKLREVKAEGFPSNAHGMALFRATWTKEGRFDPNQRVWAISYVHGDQSDTPRIPAARPGTHYVSLPALGLSGAADEVSAEDQARYAREGHERFKDVLGERKLRLQLALLEIRKHPCSPFTNAKLRAAQDRINNIRPIIGYDDRRTG